MQSFFRPLRLAFLILAFGAQVTTAQSRKTVVTFPVSKVKKFIPPSYKIFDSAVGLLNDDNRPDVLLVLKKREEYLDNQPAPARICMLLLSQPDGTFKLVASSRKAVYNRDKDGELPNSEPYSAITIDKGTFTIEHWFGGSAGVSSGECATFQYSALLKNWYLSKFKTYSYSQNYSANENEDTIANVAASAYTPSFDSVVKTPSDFGKISFKQYDIYHLSFRD